MRKRMIMMAVAGVLAVTLGACQTKKGNEVMPQEVSAAAEETEKQDETLAEPKLSEDQEEVLSEAEPEEQPVDKKETFHFSELKDVEFIFESGAGAWNTVLRIDEDGDFEGVYHDSDMGDSGEDYPDGTVYLCTFHGKFSVPEKKDEYTFRMNIEQMELDHTPETEEIEKGVRYIYSMPYGLENSGEIDLFLPGTPLEKLPEEFLNWVYYSADNAKDTYLPFYGLYNLNEQEGFAGYEYDEDLTQMSPDPETTGDYTDLDQELESVEAQAKTIEDSFQNDDLTQMEYNMKTGELYQLWDDEMNRVWGYLKESFPEDKMSEIRSEQLAWIRERDTAIEEAGADYAGGSMQAMIMNDKGAELTKTRVYELVEMLKTR